MPEGKRKRVRRPKDFTNKFGHEVAWCCDFEDGSDRWVDISNGAFADLDPKGLHSFIGWIEAASAWVDDK